MAQESAASTSATVDLLKALNKSFEAPLFTDLVIETATESLPCSKHILCLHSEFFVKALTGRFKEANSSTLSLQEDDPDAIRCLVQYCYTQQYTYSNKSCGRLQYHAQVLAVAEKYLIPHLSVLAASKFENFLKNNTRQSENDMQDLFAAIRVAWADTLDERGLIRPLIMERVIEKREMFIKHTDFVATIESVPNFASDVACALMRYKNPELEMRFFRCPCGCKETKQMIIPSDELLHLHRCFSGRSYVGSFVGKTWQEYLVSRKKPETKGMRETA